MLIYPEILKNKTYRKKDNHGFWCPRTRADGESKTRLGYRDLRFLGYMKPHLKNPK